MDFKELLGMKKLKQWQISSKLSLFCNKYNIMVKAEDEERAWKGDFSPYVAIGKPALSFILCWYLEEYEQFEYTFWFYVTDFNAV